MKDKCLVKVKTHIILMDWVGRIGNGRIDGDGGDHTQEDEGSKIRCIICPRTRCNNWLKDCQMFSWGRLYPRENSMVMELSWGPWCSAHSLRNHNACHCAVLQLGRGKRASEEIWMKKKSSKSKLHGLMKELRQAWLQSLEVCLRTFK